MVLPFWHHIIWQFYYLELTPQRATLDGSTNDVYFICKRNNREGQEIVLICPTSKYTKKKLPRNNSNLSISIRIHKRLCLFVGMPRLISITAEPMLMGLSLADCLFIRIQMDDAWLRCEFRGPICMQKRKSRRTNSRS